MKRLLVACVICCVALVAGISNFPENRFKAAEATLPADSGATFPQPPNHTFHAGSLFVSGPTNWDFESGLSGWTYPDGPGSGMVETLAGGQSGSYLRITEGSPSLTTRARSSEFLLGSGGTLFSFHLNTFGDTSAVGRVEISTSGGGFVDWTPMFSGGNGSSSGWALKTIDLSSYLGQTVKIRYASYKAVGFDQGSWRDQVPNWTRTSGAPVTEDAIGIPASDAAAGDYDLAGSTCSDVPQGAYNGPAARLPGNATLTSTPFAVPSGAKTISFRFLGEAAPSAGIKYRLSSDNYAVEHDLFHKVWLSPISVSTYCKIPASWYGATVKLAITSSSGGSIVVADGGTVSNYALFDTKSPDPVSFTTGALTHGHTDIAIPAKGIPLAFTRSYSTSALETPSDVGWGWSHNYGIRLLLASDGSVIVREADGREAYYEYSAGTLVPPEGVHNSLVQNVDNTYTMTTPEQVVYAFDPTGLLVSMKDRNNNTTSLSYSGGMLSTVNAPGGRTLTFSSSGGHITQITDALGRTVGFGYDAAGDLTTVTDTKSGVTTFTYSNHRLATITDALNQVQVTNVYDSANRVVEQTDARGGVTCFYYGAGPTYSSSACPGVTPAPNPGRTVMVDPRGNAWIHQFDLSFRPTAVEDPLGNDTFYAYSGTNCPAGNLCAVTDALGHTTSFTYDGQGNMLSSSDPLNNASQYSYDSFNNLTSSTDPLSQSTTFVYNGSGNLTSVIDELSDPNPRIVYAPNTDGTLASMTDALSHTTSFVYNASGQPTSTTDPLSHTASFTYDASGRMLTSTDALGHTTSFTYDNQNNLLTVTDALSHTTTHTYDAKGRRTSTTDANGKTTTYAYDAAGNLTTITDPLNQTVTYGYDANGNRTSLVNTRGKTTTYLYDTANRLTKVTDPTTFTRTYVYDAAGNVQQYGDGRHGGTLKTTYTYDAANRLTNVAYPDVHYTTAYTYDHANNRLTMTDTRGVCESVSPGCPVNTVASDTTTYGYDALNRLTSVQTTYGGNTKVTTFGFDAAGRRNAVGYPDGKTVGYTYDAADRMATVTTSWLSGTVTYTYDNADRLTSTQLPNGLISDRGYDNAGRLMNVLNRNGGVPISSFAYSLDGVGNRTQVVDTTGTTVLGYDGLYRLTSATYPNGDTQSYTYDAMGNRLTKVHNGVTTTHDYDDADALTKVNGVSNLVDKNGSLISLGQSNSLSDTFLYDQENRLFRTGPCRSDVNNDGASNVIDLSIIGARTTSAEGSTLYDLQANLNSDQSINVLDLAIAGAENGKNCRGTGPGTGNGRSWYNGDGLRVREKTFQTGNTLTRDFTWDVSSPLPVVLQETNAAGAVTATYLYGLDLVSVTGATTSYLLGDGLGSTTQLADGAGVVTDSYTYDVFGATRSVTGTTANDFRFTGEQQDVSVNRGLYFLRARSYDPALGRFLQQDPLPLLQKYAYAGNNPATYVDPSGLCDSMHWLSCARDVHRTFDNAAGAGGNAVGTGLQRGIAWSFNNYCQLGPAGACEILRAIDSAATRVACALQGDKEGYIDFNLTPLYGLTPTVGLQGSCTAGFHQYLGIAVSTPNLSINTAPKQSIVIGAQCAAGVTAPFIGSSYGLSVQVGRAGLLDFGTGVAGSGTSFVEAGAGTTGAGVNCSYVFPRP